MYNSVFDFEHFMIYLSGAMEFLEDSGSGWRKKVAKMLSKELGVKEKNIIDPCNKPLTNLFNHDLDTMSFEKIDYLKKMNKWSEIEKIMKYTIHLDLRFIDKADIIYAHIDTNVFTCGTIDEIITAREQNKPTILVVSGGLQKCPLWLLGRCGYKNVFPDDESAIQYLKDIKNGQRPFEPKTWLFFDLNNKVNKSG